MSAAAIRAALVEPAGADSTDTSDARLAGALEQWRARLSTRDTGALYARWREHPVARRGWGEQPWGVEDDRLVDDLRGLEFWRIRASRDRFAALATAAEAMRRSAGALRARVADTWDGAAADAAAARFDHLASAAHAWQDGLTQVSASLDGARAVTSTVLRRWSEETGALRDIAVDDLATRQTQLDRLDAALATAGPERLRGPGIDLNRGGPPWPTSEITAYLDDFCARYDVVIRRIRRDLRAVHEATARTWQTFTDTLGEIDPDPFAALTRKSTVDSRGRLTIDDDGHRVTIDAGPTLGITVDHGTGTPKTYVIDPPQTAADAASSGVGGLPVNGAAGGESAGAEGIRVERGAEAVRPGGSPDPGGAGGPGGGGGGGTDGGGSGGGSGGTGGGGTGGGGARAHEAPLLPGAATGAEAPAHPDPRQSDPRQSAVAAASPQAQGGAGQGGMMGMGGMGAGGGQGGGDTERKSSQWRLTGTLFDADDPAATFDGIVGQDPGRGR
ncbi:hypothetical protein [Actinokineospora sp. NBRC 105648]|uniref:hypothetical protein n=1 Tax=Actinokineospora sp. NBRC 105648 TaxID=3032206 RepID=UPI0024A5F5A5|nr:hypothetical protein [Actinokineospora sp. NBRC 105648]GLZ42105.1 hypothetical protein Acsp05_57290 [Actinokineospora sp. NBRC 105648]